VLEDLKQMDDRWSIFSEAEQRVAKLLAQALSDTEIAKELQLEPKTVRNHVRVILRKAEVDSRTKFVLAFQSERNYGQNRPFMPTASAASQLHRSGHSCKPRHFVRPKVRSAGLYRRLFHFFV
jgi:DNA-binding CsgD family transcriptional regulator